MDTTRPAERERRLAARARGAAPRGVSAGVGGICDRGLAVGIAACRIGDGRGEGRELSTYTNRIWTPYGMAHILQDSRQGAQRYLQFLRQDQGLSLDPRLVPLRTGIELMSLSPTLYWMNKTAVDVAAGLAAHGVPNHTTDEVLASARVSGHGFLCFAKPLSRWRWYGATDGVHRDVTWDGICWGHIYDKRHKARRFSVEILSRITGSRNMISDVRREAPLIGVGGFNFVSDEAMWEENITSNDPSGPSHTPAEYSNAAALITSVLLTMGQRRMTSQTRLGPADGVTAPKTGPHEHAEPPQVILIDLLRAPGAKSNAGTAASRREHDFRWWVRGHWRLQVCGPDNSERRLIYVEPHTKGPADKPLSNPTRVYVVRPHPPENPGDEPTDKLR